ncbi:hypothetical protein [Streptomyces prasinus]|uniref:hypothetical protein n=1 Tax=Streptomyces prasinus TaxID=67345 RepID=UPI0033D55D5B
MALAVALPEKHQPYPVLREESVAGGHVSWAGVPGKYCRHVLERQFLGRCGGLFFISIDVLRSHQLPAVKFEFDAIGALGLPGVFFEEDMPLSGHGQRLSAVPIRCRDASRRGSCSPTQIYLVACIRLMQHVLLAETRDAH